MPEEVPASLPRVVSASEEGVSPRPVLELYEEWAHRLGLHQEDFQERTGISRTALNQRRFANTVPQFSEVISVARNLGIAGDLVEPSTKTAAVLWCHPIIAQARTVWLEDVLRVPERSHAVAIVHVVLSCMGMRVNKDSVYRSMGTTQATAGNIATFCICPFKDIWGVHSSLRSVLPEQEYEEWRSLWLKEEKLARSQKTFRSMFERLSRERGLTLANIASLLGVGGESASTPSSILGKVVTGGGSRTCRGNISRALLARIVSATDEEYRSLLDGARAERSRHRARKKGNVSSPIRTERELFSLSPEFLQSKTGYNHEELLRIEEGKLRVDARETGQLIDVVRSVGEHVVQEKMRELQRGPQNVAGAIAVLVLRAGVRGRGSMKTFERKVKEDRPQRISRVLLAKIMHGDAMPALPTVQHLIEKGGGDMTPILEQDWSYEYARHGRARGRPSILTAFDGICAERDADWSHYHRRKGFRMLQTLSWLREGTCTMERFHGALHEMDVRRDTPRWIFMESLFREGAIQPALKRWYEEMQRNGLPIDLSYNILPGLTREESPKPMFDAVMGEVKERYPHLSQEYERQVADCIIPMAIDGVSTEEALERIGRNYGSHLRMQEQLALRRERLFAWTRMRDPPLVDAARAVFEHAVNDVLVEDVPEPVARKKLERFLAVHHLVQQAMKIDATVVGRARAIFEDAAEKLIEHHANASTCECVLQQTVLIERTMQWAYLTYLGPVSEYYAVLKIFVKQLIEKGRGEDEVRSSLKRKISSLTARITP